MAIFSYTESISSDNLTESRTFTEDSLKKVAQQYAKEEADRQAALKKEREDKAQYETECKKYGKENVDAAMNHQILIGMPESLFLKYFSEPWFEDKIQCSLERAYTSGNITKYRLYVHAYTYGWNSAEGKDYLLITFRNGKLDSYVR